MASNLSCLVLFICLILGVCNGQSGLKAGLFVGPQGQWESKAAQLESSLNSVRTAQSADQQRLITMSKVFSDQLTKLDKDVKVTKSALTTLLEGSVSTQRKLKTLEGMSTDITTLRGQLQRTQSSLSSLITTVQYSVQQLDKKIQGKLQAQEGLNSERAAELVHLSDKIDGLGDKTDGQDKKITLLEIMMKKLNNTMAHTTTGGSGETIAGTVRELRETFQGLKDRLDNREDQVNKQLLYLRSKIQEMKRSTS